MSGACITYTKMVPMWGNYMLISLIVVIVYSVYACQIMLNTLNTYDFHLKNKIS